MKKEKESEYVLPRAIKEDYPQPHAVWIDCAFCSYVAKRPILHSPRAVCCGQAMWTIGVWPYLYWYCHRCENKIEHDEQIVRKLKGQQMK